MDMQRFAAEHLRRSGSLPKVIAEVKFASPSAGQIRQREPGSVKAICRGYASAGAAAVSVLCDWQGFGGTPLDVRRAASCTQVPILFKEFVVDEVQVDVACSSGASYVLLLVCALEQKRLIELVEYCFERRLEPLVEAATQDELVRALETRASLIGINARNLRTFDVDSVRARSLIDQIPHGRIAVYMSGIGSHRDLVELGATRADAVLVGQALMKEADPSVALRRLRENSHVN